MHPPSGEVSRRPSSSSSCRRRARPTQPSLKQKLATAARSTATWAAMIAAITTTTTTERTTSLQGVEAFGSVTSSSSLTGRVTPSTKSSTEIFYTMNEHEVDVDGSQYHHSHNDDVLRYPIHFFQQASATHNQQQPQHLEEELQQYGGDAAAASTTNDVVLPTWLRLSRAHLVHENMELLREAMLNSFFTETEVLKLTYAIQEASNGNSDMIAGAAEFCLIMVETMEMGLNALIAGAFHYCSCVEARHKQTMLPSYEDPLSPWEFRPHQGLESFGDHAMQIATDAHRLKRLEVLASMVVQNSNTNAAATTTTSSTSDPTTTVAANLQNLLITEADDWRALAIRGAACLYRLRGIIKSTSPAHKLSKESNRVCREALHIYSPLMHRMGMHRLKNELEQAAFQLLYKRQHKTVESLLHQRRARRSSRQHADDEEDVSGSDIGESMQQILEQVQAEMSDILENDAVFMSSVSNFKVSARVKEGYSTWRKMLRNGWDHILEVPDALALRIVLDAKKEWDGESVAVTRARERALCYYAQQLCMNVWAPSADPRFKDYITHPKENGYQSLHYTATTPFNGEEWMIEVQVRSGEMNNIAEFGVASHWNYKARGKQSNEKKQSTFTSSQPSYRSNGSPISFEMSPETNFGKLVADHNTDAYLRSLQEWHWYQHGSPVDNEPLVIFDETEHQERADRIRARTPYIEALASARSDLQKENVFVFLSPHCDDEQNNQNGVGTSCSSSGEGVVVALPAGARVLDAIRKCELPDEVTSRLEESVTHNGSPASLMSPLQNGDVLSIPAVATCLTPV
eukprot:CAMPEP_0113512212 /NCGR_PEP_ID=MMETSP0014_2-20120614/39217_1 /TAXON_ID=2857 /ORGANISM="Nitzschia sp." /LENGTH=801 /DNA_ID=CAMNT_0000408551 /DNA_START=233 /DNA_END=2638 /DNA_ORIENTATION=+ /assembly_acc=CAM_ASM_000159